MDVHRLTVTLVSIEARWPHAADPASALRTLNMIAEHLVGQYSAEALEAKRRAQVLIHRIAPDAPSAEVYLAAYGR